MCYIVFMLLLLFLLIICFLASHVLNRLGALYLECNKFEKAEGKISTFDNKKKNNNKNKNKQPTKATKYTKNKQTKNYEKQNKTKISNKSKASVYSFFFCFCIWKCLFLSLTNHHFKGVKGEKQRIIADVPIKRCFVL